MSWIRPALYALACVAVLGAQDCDSASDLILVNRSNEPLAITLEARRGYPRNPACHCPDGFIHPALAVTPAADERRLRAGPWIAVDSLTLQYDTSAVGLQLFLHLSLAPQTALRLGQVSLTGNRITGEAPFWTLELTGAGRTQRYDGGMVGEVFKRTSGIFVYDFTSGGPPH